jgi:hypothetical protein
MRIGSVTTQVLKLSFGAKIEDWHSQNDLLGEEKEIRRVFRIGQTPQARSRELKQQVRSCTLVPSWMRKIF